jgi:hypothetical protein
MGKAENDRYKAAYCPGKNLRECGSTNGIMQVNARIASVFIKILFGKQRSQI